MRGDRCACGARRGAGGRWLCELNLTDGALQQTLATDAWLQFPSEQFLAEPSVGVIWCN